MPHNDPNLMNIFAEALERTDPGARAAYLAEACAGNAPLRQRVEALLAAHEGAGHFLEPDSTGVSETSAPETKRGSQTTPQITVQGSAKSSADTHPPMVQATEEHGPHRVVSTLAGNAPEKRAGAFMTGEVIAGKYTLLDVSAGPREPYRADSCGGGRGSGLSAVRGRLPAATRRRGAQQSARHAHRARGES
jgi:hypothetical protein